MADTIPFPPQGNTRKNLKADQFEAYMKQEGLNFFRRREAHDSYDTVVFMTAVPAGKQTKHRLVCAVITDNSLYTLIRVHLGTAPKGPARDTFIPFLNKLNAQHAIIKYSISADDNVFLDVCIVARDANFDPSVVRDSMDLMVYLLGEEYDDVARRLDKPGDQTNGFEL